MNVDTLVGSKVDSKVTGLIFAEMLIIERIELTADKVNANEIEKLYLQRERNRERGLSRDEGAVKRISQNPSDTWAILAGVGKNLQ